MPEEKKDISEQEAAEKLLQERHKRQEACRLEVQESLRKHRCTLDATMVCKSGQAPQMQVNIVGV